MKYLTWRNFFILPLVLLIRAPIVLALLAIIRTGEFVNEVYESIEPWLPALKPSGKNGGLILNLKSK